jgi:nucleoside-diphosphate-sugar epimerase
MIYLLTGATGFVGGSVARQLLAAGHSVRAIVRTPSKAADLTRIGVELVPGDVTDKNSMRTPMTGVDGVYHIAGWYKIGVRDRQTAVGVNIDGTRNVLELMDELGVARGVYTSTLAVNSDTHGQVVDETYRFAGRHVSLYDETKAEAHRIAESFIARGLPLVIVQPGLIYGPGDTSGVRTTFLQFLQRKLPVVPRQTAYSWGHIEDVARAHLQAMARGQTGRNYHICGPSHTLEYAIDLASEITGVPAPRIRVGPGVLRAASRLTQLVEPILPFPPAYTSEGLRVVGGVTYLGDNTRARTELGCEFRPLREGLAETLKHELELMGIKAR